MTVETGPVVGHGHAQHVGRRVATASGEIRDGRDRLLASAVTTCLVFDLG